LGAPSVFVAISGQSQTLKLPIHRHFMESVAKALFVEKPYQGKNELYSLFYLTSKIK
jgi:hypothetical protein